MKLVGNLKKQVEETKSKEEAKKVIEKAGMELTDEELDNVTGGQELLAPIPEALSNNPRVVHLIRSNVTL